MYDQLKMRLGVPAVHVGVWSVFVGERLGDGPEGHVELTAAAVPGAQARPVRCGQQPHPPPVPAQHPGHGQRESLCVEFEQFAGAVVTEAAACGRASAPDPECDEESQEDNSPEGSADPECAIARGQYGDHHARRGNHSGERRQYVAETGAVASLCSQGRHGLPSL